MFESLGGGEGKGCIFVWCMVQGDPWGNIVQLFESCKLECIFFMGTRWND